MSKYQPLIGEYLITKVKLESNIVELNKIIEEYSNQIKEYERIYKLSVNFHGPEKEVATKKLNELNSIIFGLINDIAEEEIKLSIDSLNKALRVSKREIVTQINIDKLDDVNEIEIHEAIFLNDENIAYSPLERFGEISCNKRMAEHTGSGYFKSTDDERDLERMYRTYPNTPKVEKMHMSEFEWLKGYLKRR